MNFNKKTDLAGNNKRNLNSEKTFLYFFILLIFFLLISSSNRFPGLTYSPTGAAISTKILQNANYVVGFIVFAFLIVALFLAFFLLKIKKNKKRLEFSEETTPLAALNRKKPLIENLDQVNLELKNLRKEKKELIKKKKLTNLPDPNKINLHPELNEESSFLSSSDKPLILEVPQDKNKLDRDLAKIEKEINQLGQLKFKKVKILDEIPPMPLDGRFTKKKKLKKLKKITAAIFGKKER